jgi:3,4-dihydroxy 2-butanone 4-phosphate synthase/GTP cyclohydrolase II
VLQAIEEVAKGRPVVVVDDADRENEGDLICSAALAGDNNNNIGFMVRHTSGVLCVSVDDATLSSLCLPPMVPPESSQDPKGTAYSISVDYVHPEMNPSSTGISAADRALTFRMLAQHYLHAPEEVQQTQRLQQTRRYFQRPGHVFPLRYKPGGVLARRGHTEASYDLSLLAGITQAPGGVLAEIVHEDGSLMRAEALRDFSAANGLVMTSVQDLVAYRLELLAEDSRYRDVVKEVFQRHHQQ